jgi:hypothetical protein
MLYAMRTRERRTALPLFVYCEKLFLPDAAVLFTRSSHDTCRIRTPFIKFMPLCEVPRRPLTDAAILCLPPTPMAAHAHAQPRRQHSDAAENRDAPPPPTLIRPSSPFMILHARRASCRASGLFCYSFMSSGSDIPPFRRCRLISR